MLIGIFLKRWPPLAAVVLATPLIAQESPLDETVSFLEEWVETEQKIAESQAEWEADKASMESLISLYEQELTLLNEQIESAREDTSAAEAKRSGLLEKEERIRAIEENVEKQIIEAEKALKRMTKRLPPPLREELSPLFNSLPEDSENTKLALGQRIQPIIAILTQTQKFDQVVTVVKGYREFEEGRTVQTDTIYFGLGIAYYVDQANEHAGLGVPGEDGWNWNQEDALALRIRRFLDIYQGSKQAEYIQLPVKVQ